jgi:hypothetical protein
MSHTVTGGRASLRTPDRWQRGSFVLSLTDRVDVGVVTWNTRELTLSSPHARH